MTINDLVKEIKIDLGSDVNSLGISDESIRVKIEEALRKVGAYAPCVESDTFSVSNGCVLLPVGTMAVTQVLTIDKMNANTNRTYENDVDLFSVSRYLYNYNDLHDPFIYLMQKNQLNTLQNFIKLSDWRYEKSKNTLYLSNYNKDTVSVIYLRRFLEIPDVQDDELLQTIKEYALALCKIVEGTIRRKLQSAPGAIQMDGDQLVSEGTAEKQRLDEWIPKQYSYLRFGIRA